MTRLVTASAVSTFSCSAFCCQRGALGSGSMGKSRSPVGLAALRAVICCLVEQVLNKLCACWRSWIVCSWGGGWGLICFQYVYVCVCVCVCACARSRACVPACLEARFGGLCVCGAGGRREGEGSICFQCVCVRVCVCACALARVSQILNIDGILTHTRTHVCRRMHAPTHSHLPPPPPTIQPSWNTNGTVGKEHEM